VGQHKGQISVLYRYPPVVFSPSRGPEAPPSCWLGLGRTAHTDGKRRLRQCTCGPYVNQMGSPPGPSRKPIEAAEVVDPETPRAGQPETGHSSGQPCAMANAARAERVVSIVGTDEVDLNRNHISWVSPLGRAVMKSAAGDSVGYRPVNASGSLVIESRQDRPEHVGRQYRDVRQYLSAHLCHGSDWPSLRTDAGDNSRRHGFHRPSAILVGRLAPMLSR
jgi:hypothetical protein